MNIAGQRALRARGGRPVHGPHRPLDVLNRDALLPEGCPAPRVARRRPFVGANTAAPKVRERAKVAATPHEEAPMPERAHDEERDADEAPVALRNPDNVAAERELPRV